MVSVILSLSFSSVSPMPYTPSAAGALSVVVDSMQMLFGRRVGWCPGITPFGHIEGLASGSDVAVTVEPETPFLFVVPLVEGEGSRRMGTRRGRARKEERQGGVVPRSRLERSSCLARL